VLDSAASQRAELFRLFGDEDRLRLLALCTAEELTVGELATLLGESQPQVTRKSQALREAGLLLARRDGTRTLLRSEEPSRQFFSREAGAPAGEAARAGAREAWAPFLPLLAPLVPGRSLAVDVGAGEGTLLPLLSPIFERVVAIDRSAARLARCAERVAALGLPNVRLREGTVDDAAVVEEIERGGGADLVVLARVLHHAARPQDLVTGAARLLRAGGHIALVDHVPHEEEGLREQGHVWLGFEPARLRTFLETPGLRVVFAGRLGGDETPPLQLVVGQKPGPGIR
jgi:ArsR family transcriptional regulator